MRRLAIASILAGLALAAPPQIVVSQNHRFLQQADGTPFFWLADTGWLLFSRLDQGETERYLEDRRRKGFNVIQVMVLHSAAMRSAAGVPALVDGDPGRPLVKPEGGDYWSHVDWLLDRAAEKGIYVAMVPAWGSLVKSGQLNSKNVEAYATFLARRYRSRPNLFWLTGGDIEGNLHADVWKRMGQVLKAEDPAHLVSYHPFGRTLSATWFHNEPWLDFNMFQSGHRRYDQDTASPHKFGEDNWRYVLAAWERAPVKPVLDGEPSYEGIPQGLHDTAQPYWNANDCRRYAYWSVFAGAFGHTYGHSAVMQFHKPGRGKGSYGPKSFWTEAIGDPGAGQMQFLKRLVLSRPYFDRVPGSTLIPGNGTRYEYVAATRGKDYVFAYSYTGKPFEVRLGVISGARVEASWYNPRDGSTQKIGSFPNQGTRRFTPPGTPRPGNDWVLVLDGAE